MIAVAGFMFNYFVFPKILDRVTDFPKIVTTEEVAQEQMRNRVTSLFGPFGAKAMIHCRVERYLITVTATCAANVPRDNGTSEIVHLTFRI